MDILSKDLFNTLKDLRDDKLKLDKGETEEEWSNFEFLIDDLEELQKWDFVNEFRTRISNSVEFYGRPLQIIFMHSNPVTVKGRKLLQKYEIYEDYVKANKLAAPSEGSIIVNGNVINSNVNTGDNVDQNIKKDD